MDTDTIDEAAKFIEANAEPVRTDELTLSNGVRLKIKPVAQLMMRMANRQIVEPHPPVAFNQDKGREEENPEDPAYKQAIVAYNYKVEDMGTSVMLGLGTEVLSVPADVIAVDDDAWIEQLEAYTEIRVNRESRPARYVSWLAYYVLSSAIDLNAVVQAASIASGVREEDVAQAMDSFRGGAGRGTDPERQPGQDAGHGDQVPAGVPGDRAADRGDGHGEVSDVPVAGLADPLVSVEG